jgi:RNA polymerase sigma factor (sigma-70 family)
MIEVPTHNPEDSLQENLRDAVQKIGTYINTPGERVLRQHQADVMQDLHDAFIRGEGEGYVHLPTGSGKTVVATELARVLDKKTIIVSPTRLILGQTHDKAEKYSPALSISNYYSEEKDLSGKVINTTYNSLLNLLEAGQLDPSEIELLIADEAHVALGLQRHTLFKHFPRAILIGLTATPEFSRLDFYERVGKVEQGERWANMFKNKFHEMTKEEAIERGVLSPLDIHILRTLSVVGDIHITSAGEYREDEKNKYLNREIRNQMAIGILAGTDKISADVEMDDETLGYLKSLYEEVRGRRTVFFGLGIDHAEDMAERLRALGLSAESVHGKIPEKKRNEFLKRHASGETQIITGVDLIRLGWDSPATEVGLFWDLTQSPVVLEQSLGRILRLSEETGKARATAIQPLDTFMHRNQEPLKLPHLFDPNYVMSRPASFPLKHEKSTTHKKEVPSLTFSGVDMKVLLEDYSSNEILQNRFRSSSLDEVEAYIEALTQGILKRKPDIDPLTMYRELAEEMPARISNEFSEKVAQAVASVDSNLAARGRKVLTFVYMGSILSAVKDYLTSDPDKNSDIVESAIVSVMERISRLSGKVNLAQQIYTAAKAGAVRFVTGEYYMDSPWVQSTANYNAIKNKLKEEGIGKRKISSGEEAIIVQSLAERTGISPEVLRSYLRFMTALKPLNTGDEPLEVSSSSDQEAEAELVREQIEKVLSTLTSRERRVLELRFGLDGKGVKTLEEVGLEFGVYRERIRQIEAKALRKLRHPSRSKWIKGFFVSEGTGRDTKRPGYESWMIMTGRTNLNVMYQKYAEKYLENSQMKLIDILKTLKGFGEEIAEPLISEGSVEVPPGYVWDSSKETALGLISGKLVYFQRGEDTRVIDWYWRNKRGSYFYEGERPNYSDTTPNETLYMKKIGEKRYEDKDNSIAHLNLSPNTFLSLVAVTENFFSFFTDMNLSTVTSLKQAVNGGFFSGPMHQEIRSAIDQFERETPQT